MTLIDTHCHIHESNYPLDIGDTLRRAHEAGVTKLVCVGTSEASSRAAIDFVASHDNAWASLGVHPHDTKDGWNGIERLLKTADLTKVVAIGEIGLDYFYTHSPRDIQIEALESQLQLAVDYGLPVVFHVREAFDDFWPIIANFPSIRGVLHSFTDSIENLNKALTRGFYLGVNGISTFTKDIGQQQMFDTIPLEKMLLETDAPFLTPSPHRGKVNEPAFVGVVAEYHAKRRGISVDEIASTTTANATALFAH